MFYESDRRTRRLLTCGLIAGPLFLAVAVLQGLTRSGFDLGHQPISFLSLGALGWLQRLNFIVVGLLVVAFAAGLRRALASGRARWPAACAVGLGLGLVIAGVFAPDPGFRYPPGTPDGSPKHPTYHSALHGLGFTLALLSFSLLAVVFARRAASERRWAWCAYTASTVVAVLGLGMPGGDSDIAVRDLVAAALLWFWVSMLSIRLLQLEAAAADPHHSTTSAREASPAKT